MFHYTVNYWDKEGNKYDIGNDGALPLKDMQTLDDTLDATEFDLVDSSISQPFEPFTKFKFTITDKERDISREFYRYVGHDTVEQISMHEPYLYNHSIILTEPTKILEREVCDNLSFTNTLLSQTSFEPKEVEGLKIVKTASDEKNWKYEYAGVESEQYFNLYLNKKKIRILDCDLYYFSKTHPILPGTWSKWQNQQIILKGDYIERDVSKNEEIELNAGAYKVIYSSGRKDGFGRPIEPSCEVTFSIVLYNSDTPPKRKSLSENLQRLLDVTPTQTKNSFSPKYKIDSHFYNKHLFTECPEFMLTGKTLWEALRDFGSVIHSIPYLKVTDDNWNTIDFMPLGSKDKVSEKGKLIGNNEEWDMEQYATNIDSYVSNIMNVDDDLQGAVVEPYEDGSIAVNSEDGEIEITEATALFKTTKPIYKLVELYVGLSNNNLKNITDYVEESSKYALLSNFNDTPGASKSMALEYTQGQSHVKGLSFKQKGSLDAESTLVYAIVHILKKEFKVNASNADLPKLKYRVKYIPYVSMRIKQYKPNCLEFRMQNTLIFNQQANVVDSIAYGENMKGTIARLGNKDIVRTYMYKDLLDIPKVGAFIDDNYYIATVKSEYYGDFIKTTVQYSKDFNKLSEYIGIKNELRFYEVSEKNSLQRNIHFDEFCIIGDDMGDATSCITSKGVETFKQVFTHNANINPPVSCFHTQGISKDGEQRRIIIPVSSIACGNSLALYANFNDNTTAGIKSIADGNRSNRLQEIVPYCDSFGALDELKIKAYGNVGTSSDDIAYNLPLFENAIGQQPYFDLWDNPLIIRKDSREVLSATFQVHLISNKKNIVIGSALSQNNPIICRFSEKKVAKIVFLDYNIGKFDKYIEDGTAYANRNISDVIIQSGKKIVIQSMTAPVNAKSWVIVDNENRLLLGVNEEASVGQSTSPIYFNFKNNLR